VLPYSARLEADVALTLCFQIALRCALAAGLSLGLMFNGLGENGLTLNYLRKMV
jgi:hypothetical protein